MGGCSWGIILVSTVSQFQETVQKKASPDMSYPGPHAARWLISSILPSMGHLCLELSTQPAAGISQGFPQGGSAQDLKIAFIFSGYHSYSWKSHSAASAAWLGDCLQHSTVGWFYCPVDASTWQEFQGRWASAVGYLCCPSWGKVLDAPAGWVWIFGLPSVTWFVLLEGADMVFPVPSL